MSDVPENIQCLRELSAWRGGGLAESKNQSNQAQEAIFPNGSHGGRQVKKSDVPKTKNQGLDTSAPTYRDIDFSFSGSVLF